ncbi:MAG: hypothetical protein WBM83_04680 [Flavobacteriaceae bacterium]
MKHLFFTIVLFGSYLTSAQTSLNDYKYVIVPTKFEVFKTANQYQTSTLLKHLLTQKGFNAVYDNALPEDLKINRCLALHAELVDDSSMFTTKTSVSFIDCNGVEIFVTEQGSSKVKDYKTAYKETITMAAESLPFITYTEKAIKEEPITVSFKNDVKTLDDTKKGPKNKVDKMVVSQEATTERQSYKSNVPVASNIKKPVIEETIADEASSKEQAESKTLVSSDMKKSQTGNEVSIVVKSSQGVLYAQAIPNGYQLVDSTPKIKMRIFSTSLPDHFLVESDDRNGIVYSKNGKWIFEYYEDGQLNVEELDIKF